MGALNAWKKRAAAQTGQNDPPMNKAVRRQLRVAAGAEYFENRDPVYHVSEDFRRAFDLMGSAKAARGETGRNGEEHGGVLGALEPNGSWRTAGMDGLEQAHTDMEAPGMDGIGGEGALRDRLMGKADMSGLAAPGEGANRMFLSRFADIAFQRGTLAGAVLRGTGKLMLVSCLKRTVGQSQPKNLRQRMLFEGASARRNVSGSPPDKALFNRGEVDGAVGLVVDTLKDARRTVETMSALARGDNVLGENSGAKTLQKMYPFLSDARERELLSAYRERLGELPPGERGANDRAALQGAIVKAEALIAKKAKMKVDFITALRGVSDRAQAALELFTQPGFQDELMTELMLGEGVEEPPPEDGGGGDNSKPRRSTRGTTTQK